MSTGAVDTKTVEMRFDNQDFEKNCKQSISTLDKLKAALKLDGASKGLSDIEKQAKKLDMKDLQNSVDTVGKKFSALETIATGVFLKIGMSAADAGMKMVKSLTFDQIASGWNKYEEKTTAVQTIMSNLTEAEGKFIDDAAKMEYVNGYLEKLMWFSDETSYSFTDMTSNVGKFIANGQSLSDSVTAMQGIATWAAKSGQNTQAAARAMYNISQAMGTGSMKVKDWMSIENANMATAEFKQLAITIGENQGKLKKGQVAVEQFRDSLSGKDTKDWFDKDVMMEVFETYGAAADRIQELSEKTGKTATEVIKDLKNSADESDKAFVDSLGFKAFAAAQEAKTFREAIAATSDAVSTKWMRIFEGIFGNYLQQKELWTGLAEDLWDIFAGPLDTVSDVLDAWNTEIEGVEKSGRELLISGVKNVFDTLFHSYTDEDGKEFVSLFGSIKKAFQGVFFAGETAESVGKKLKDLTARFHDFSVKLKDFLYNPETNRIKKIQNAFEGLFRIFKIGGKLVTAIVKPFTELLQSIIPGGLSGVIDLADDFGTLMKNFEEFLDEIGAFEAISDGIRWIFTKIGEGADWLSKKLSGLSFKDLLKKAKLKISDFFQNTDFKSVFQTIGSYFSNIVEQIKIVNTDKLPEKLTPLQNFFIGLKNIFNGFKTFFSYISPAFKFIGEKINNFFTSIGDAFKNKKLGNAVSRFQPIFDGLKSIFGGIGDFFASVGPTLKKIGDWIGQFFGKLGEGIAKFAENKSAEEIIRDILKGGFIVALTDFVLSLAGLNWGGKGLLESISDGMDAIKGVLKAYQREINVSTLLELAMSIGVLASSMWILAQIPADRLHSVGKALFQIAVVLAGFSILKEIIKWLTKASNVVEGRDPNTLFGKIRSLITGVVQTSIFANDASAKFMKFSAGIALLALAFKQISNNLEPLSKGIIALGESAQDPNFKSGLKAFGIIAAGIAVIGMFSTGVRPLAPLAVVLSLIILTKYISQLVTTISDLGANTNYTFFKSGLYMFAQLALVVTAFLALNSIGGSLKGMIGFALALNAIIGIIWSIALTLKLLTKDVDADKLKKAAAIVEAISKTLLWFLVALAAIEKVGKKRGSVALAGAGVLAAAAGIYLIAMALEKLANIKPVTLGFAASALKQMAITIGVVLGVLSLVAGLNFKVGKVTWPVSGAFWGTLGVPIGAISFVIACAGVWVIAQALSALGDAPVPPENIKALRNMSWNVLAITAILGVLASVDIGGYATVGAGGLAGGYFGTLGIPAGALAFAIACAGVYVMARALAELASVSNIDNVGPAMEAIKSLSWTVFGIVALLGLLASFNIAGLVGPVVIGASGTLGVPAAAVSFTIACAGILLMAKALAELSDGVDAASLETARTNIEELAKTIRNILLLLSVVAAFTGLGMLEGAISFDIIVFGIDMLVDVLEKFSRVDLSGLEENLGHVADALREFFERAGEAIDKMIELGEKILPTALKVGAAFVVLGLGMVTIGAGLLVIGIGLEALGEGASTAADGINEAADGFVELSGKDLSGIGKNLAIMAAALVGISIAGLAASPGLISLGFAIEAVLGPISRAISAVESLLTAINKLKNGDGSGSGGSMPGINVTGTLLPGWLGWLGGLAENIWRASRDSEKAAEEVPVAAERGIKTGTDKAAEGIKAQGTAVDENYAEGINSGSSMVESEAYKAWEKSVEAAKSPELLSQASDNGIGLLAAVLGIGGSGGGFMSLDALGIGEMKVSELLSGAEGGKGKASAVGSLIASVFGDSYSSYDWAGMAGKSLDEVIVTLSNGKIDIATAGELLTSVFGDKWKDYKWEDLTINDIVKVMSASMKDAVPELENAAKEATGSTADAMEDSEHYGATMGKNVLGAKAALGEGVYLLSEEAGNLAAATEAPLTSLDSYSWGSHISEQYASGIKSKLAAVEAAARALANAIAGYLHFSEPDVGPLSDFHTYAPDMIKLWCKGVYDNLGKVEDSSESMADTVYDGFSTALEYVSDLIDDGMSDELTIRPIMDLSEIQNGIHNLDSMIGGANGYSLSGTAKLAASAASGFTPSASVNTAPAEANAAGPVTNYNTFNITNNDPEAVAQKVSKLIGQETKRAQAVWAR